MDRIHEFNEIIEKLTKEKETDETSILRNRKHQSDKLESEPIKNVEVYNFSKSLLNECTLTNSTLLQLSKKLKEISQKPEQIKFSFSSKTFQSSSSNDKIKEIEEALNICSMNISIMRKKLEEFKDEKVKQTDGSSFFSKLFNSNPNIVTNPILEHVRLVILFLESRIGRITEDLESYKLRKKNREKLLSIQEEKNSYTSTFGNKVTLGTSVNTTNTHNTTTTNALNTTTNTLNDLTMSMLQVENTRMIEEMSRGLFETLSSTETQILELSRLQSTLQSHLSMQHDLTCRLFEDSITTVQDTKKGNEYLRKTGKDSSTMRKFLVTLILSMSLLLLLLHYFNK